MNAFPWFGSCGLFVSKGIVVLSGALALTISSACGGLTIDLRVGAVSGPGSMVDEKSVFDVDVGSIITLQIWAEITSVVTPVNNIYGIQTLWGSIKTRSSPETGGNVRGNMSTAVISAPFNDHSELGQVGELTVPADGSLDLGTNSTVSLIGNIKFRSNILGTGEPIYGSQGQPVFFVTNNVPAGATVNPLAGGGYEFLMGTADFTINAVLDDSDPALSVSWFIPASLPPLYQNLTAIWTAGDGIFQNGTPEDLISVGDPVEISAAPSPVPEPGTFVALIAGAITLLSFRRTPSRISPGLY